MVTIEADALMKAVDEGSKKVYKNMELYVINLIISDTNKYEKGGELFPELIVQGNPDYLTLILRPQSMMERIAQLAQIRCGDKINVVGKLEILSSAVGLIHVSAFEIVR